MNSRENSSIAAIGVRAEYKGTIARSIFSGAEKSSRDSFSVTEKSERAVWFPPLSRLSLTHKAASQCHTAALQSRRSSLRNHAAGLQFRAAALRYWDGTPVGEWSGAIRANVG